MKESFVLFTEQKEIINKLSDEQAGKIFKALFDYVTTEEVPEEIENELATDIVFTTIRQTIDRNNEKWEEIKQKRSDAGKKHKGNQYGTNGTKENKMEQMEQNGTNGTNNVNVNVNDNVNVNVDEEKEKEKEAPASAPADKVMTFYLNNINPMPLEHEIELLEDYRKQLCDDLLLFAMQKAVENKSRTLKYIKAIWDSWLSKGITTLAEAKEEKRPKKVENSIKYYDSSGQYDDAEQYYTKL